jgi:hypothetical protein
MTARFLLSILIVLSGTFCRAAEPITCPETIRTHQELTAPVAGWTAMLDDAPHNLAGITFYDGPPAEKASLVYDRMQRSKGGQTATWSFAPQQQRQTWVACSYSGTAMELSRALPLRIATCAVTYDTQQQIAGLPVIKKVSCR